ncbi:MAG TPA: Xaa-Pro peptidase family protein [Bryobacteraceae bacterium]|jgi:Xaa-Pro dipeptidase|nr:Xaa-Pro peptidase family protein [Bryobacteraceae bacterium]
MSSLLSRRSFFQLSSVVASTNFAAGAAPQPALPPATSERPLPPAIAALQPLTGEARAFTNAEREIRIEKARKLMAAHAIGGIVLSGGASAQYFANLQIGGGERLWAVVIPLRGTPFLVCPAFEEGRARELLARCPFGPNADVRTWQEDEDPYRLLISSLKDRGAATGRLGVDETMKFVFSDGLSRAGGSALQIVSATPVTAGCRMIKEPHEIDCLRLAAKATLLVYAAVYNSLKEGMTQHDVTNLVQAAYGRVGFPGEASVNVAEYTALPHGSRVPQIIREGTIIMLDDGCRVEGYTSDITRTFVLGKPAEKMRTVFEIVHRAQQAALHAAKPGVPNEALDAAARKVIVDAGYGPGFKYFSHRVGHGLGMEMHEWNYLVRNNMFGSDRHPVLEAGMVFSDEPGIYIKGEFGIRLEDDMHITPDGAELLTPASPSLEQPFGSSKGA